MQDSRISRDGIHFDGPDTPRKPDTRRSKPPVELDPIPNEGEEEGSPEDRD